MGAGLPVLADVVRSGFVEGHHRGSVVVVTADESSPLLALGDVGSPMFPRSANKPLQAVGMLTAGLAKILDRVTPAEDPAELLALVASSHSGEPRHRALAVRLLELAGLDEAALGCPPALPMDDQARTDWLRAGNDAAPLCRDCSGKHAGMLATAVAAGWPLEGYLDPDHPVQRACRAEVEQWAEEPVTATGVDGCGAPLFAISLRGLARAHGCMAVAPRQEPAGRVADAMRRHPEVVGGTGRTVTRLMDAVPGLIAKDGAEAVFAAGVGEGPHAGTGIAVKIDDGAMRAAGPVLVAALRGLGIDAAGFDDLAETPLLGGGVPVGGVRPRPLPFG